MSKRAKKIRAVSKNKKSAASPLRWFFPSTDHGEDSGFADALLEYFQGDHEKYIAREAIQNAVDARLDYDRPISVVFEKFSIPASDVPGHAELLDTMNRCLKFVAGQPKAEAFFKGAIDLLKGKKITILKISDFNTKGLSGGDSDVEGNWYRLVRATGTSNLKGVGGGSFGIGKGAPIAASELRAVFYSSINDNGELVCQGKARLVSHKDERDDVRQGVGFYGVDGYRAIREAKLVPALFRRQERGTDIYIIGYKSDRDWKDKLVKSVLENFWLTILHGNLEITVRDGEDLTITQDNVGEFLDTYDAGNARYYFEAMKGASQAGSTQIFEEELKHLGKVSLYVKKGDRYPRRVMMVRKPKMLVWEKQSYALREEYAGVFICENDRGNELLRDLEPPAHDTWDKNRSEKGLVVYREFENFIKQSLKTMADSLTTEPEDIPGLDRYLPDSEDREYTASEGEAYEETGLSSDEESAREIGADRESESAGSGTITRKGIITTKQPGPIKPTPPEGPGNGKRGRGTGPDKGSAEGVRIHTSSITFRSFIQNGKKGPEYRLVITAREDCEGAIRLVAVGDDGNYPLDIESAVNAESGGIFEVGESLIKGLALKAGEVARIAVCLASGKKYTLGIETYEG